MFLLLLLLAREFANRYVFVPLMTTKERKGEQKVNTRPIKFLNFFNKCENASFEISKNIKNSIIYDARCRRRPPSSSFSTRTRTKRDVEEEFKEEKE